MGAVEPARAKGMRGAARAWPRGRRGRGDAGSEREGGGTGEREDAGAEVGGGAGEAEKGAVEAADLTRSKGRRRLRVRRWGKRREKGGEAKQEDARRG